jgi:hypothetical protein
VVVRRLRERHPEDNIQMTANRHRNPFTINKPFSSTTSLGKKSLFIAHFIKPIF